MLVVTDTIALSSVVYQKRTGEHWYLGKENVVDGGDGSPESGSKMTKSVYPGKNAFV